MLREDVHRDVPFHMLVDFVVEDGTSLGSIQVALFVCWPHSVWFACGPEVHHDITVAAALARFKDMINVPQWRPYAVTIPSDNVVVSGRHRLRTAMGFSPALAHDRRVRPRLD